MKINKIVTLFFSFALFFSFIAQSHAENKTFVKEYTYQASELDSKLSCRTIAFEQIKRLLLEELGTYLESMTEVKNFQLTKDQISTLTAGIVSAEIITEKWDGVSYYMKAKITADPQEVAKSVDKLRKDHQKTKELEDLKKKAETYLQELEQLKKELAAEKARNDKSTIQTKKKQYETTANNLSATALIEKAVESVEKEKYDDAIKYCNKAITLDPQYARAYALRGNVQGTVKHNKKQHIQAMKDLNKAIDLDPTDAALYYTLRGEVYYYDGQYDLAIQDYTKAIEINSKYTYAYHSRATVYEMKSLDGPYNYYNQAIEDYTKVVEIDPTDTQAYHKRGDIYSNMGLYDAAIQDYSKAIEINIKNAAVYNSRGFAYIDKGLYDQAIQDFTKAIELNSKNASGIGYYGRGLIYFYMELFGRAIEDFTNALKLNQNFPSAYIYRGRAYAAKGLYDRAIQDYTKAIKIVNTAEAYYYRSIAYKSKGQDERAKKDFNKAIELDPKYLDEN